MKIKWRIKEYTQNNGATYYRHQFLFMFFWITRISGSMDYSADRWRTEGEAREALDFRLGKKVKSTRIIKL